ncbi:MAG: fused MFS/spermidine synthase [Myxococcota bacterium]
MLIRNAIAIAACCASGFAGLLYEVCWIRRATLAFGSTTFAVSTVLAVFFLGLALGGYAFGRIAARAERPLRLFAWMELAVAALAYSSSLLFDLADSVYGSAARALGEQLGILFAIRVGLISLILLPPTLLMGGTLPVFCRQFVVDRARIGTSTGLLYSVNTLGGALGCAATGLWLLPLLGMRDTITLGVGLNVLIAATVAAVGYHARAPRPRSEAVDAVSPVRSNNPGLVKLLVFLIGAITLGNEVLWTRFLALVAHNTVHTYTMTLTVVLVGIVLGSALASRIADRAAMIATAFGGLQLIAGLVVAFAMLLPPGFWQAFGGQQLGIYVSALLPAAILSGAAFPLAVRMVVSDPADASRGVGGLLAANTLGGVVGSLAVGFAALPVLGLQSALRITTGASLAVGAIAWFAIDRQPRVNWRLAAFAGAAALWLGLPTILKTQIPADYLASDGELIAYKEGRSANVAVIRRPGIVELEIDRLWQGQDYKSHQALVAHVPMLLHPDPRRVAVVGIGAGQTPSRFLMYAIDELDCIDIEPAVFDMIRDHFDSAWMNDPRVRLVWDDGRSYLDHSARQYDVISLELGQISRPGVPFFYTADFYESARARLAPGGLVTQFLPLGAFTSDQFAAVVATFLGAFPNSVLWYNTSELLLIGTNASQFEIPMTRLSLLDIPGPVRRDLSYSHWGDSRHPLRDRRVFLANLLLGPEELAALARGAPIYRDDRPVLDYTTSRISFSELAQHPTLTALEELLTPLDRWLPDIAPEELAEIESIRRRNLGDIRVAATLSRADAIVARRPPGAIVEILEAVVPHNPSNFLARRMLGQAHARLQQFDGAVREFSIAIESRPEDAQARRGLARALYRQGNYAASIEQYRTELGYRPANPAIHTELATVLHAAGDKAGSQHHFDEAVRLREAAADGLQAGQFIVQ